MHVLFLGLWEFCFWRGGGRLSQAVEKTKNKTSVIFFPALLSVTACKVGQAGKKDEFYKTMLKVTTQFI